MHYTASGIITPVGLVHGLREDSLNPCARPDCLVFINVADHTNSHL